ncbi:hypothetical protein H6P81_010903 [Aristolochia fimbriata]|uniref:Uncharacterized protein n=1 Tax=Aristolochia fimbriata TaxID=158543 RepID=A0AAV7EQ26_ARIFI|nr:hypothetical protein H6P81_010903 [Aristolochia fimbriata]
MEFLLRKVLLLLCILLLLLSCGISPRAQAEAANTGQGRVPPWGSSQQPGRPLPPQGPIS